MTTAAEVITDALRLYGILDQTETAGDSDIANNVAVLNNLLRNEHMDGAAQYLITRVNATIPQGVIGQISSFSIGTAQSAYLVQRDAVALKALWCNDTSPTVNRQTRQAPSADVVRTTFPGTITRWHQERQTDGSVLVTVWQPPRSATPVLLEIGGRVPAITKTDGGDVVPLPPEGIHDITLLLGRRIFGSYGRSVAAVQMILTDSEAVDRRWRDWAKGQQWLQMLRR
jgi:hypothetical protein